MEAESIKQSDRIITLLSRFRHIRQTSRSLTADLETEDFVVQPITDVSPPKWHLGHTTWFFEVLVLDPYYPEYEFFHHSYPYIFNSYYESAGERVARPERGHQSRPTVREVMQYRKYVDEHMELLFEKPPVDENDRGAFLDIIELGLNHEEQHQELYLMDLKYIFYNNVLRPAFNSNYRMHQKTDPVPARFIEQEGGVVHIGMPVEQSNPPAGKLDPLSGFSYDNERGRHRRFLEPFAISNRPVTNGEFLEFISDGGYSDFRHWLSDGWDTVQQEKWKAPLYWEQVDGQWTIFTLNGTMPLHPDEPVSHLSFFEAEAFARWAGYRLPTEFEWEYVATHNNGGQEHRKGNFMETAVYHPLPVGADFADDQHKDRGQIHQLFGDVWEWTSSSYEPYPYFNPLEGTPGEYNGKFMNDQRILRGGACVTPTDHIRPTYRNFFQSNRRWPFTGFRLAGWL